METAAFIATALANGLGNLAAEGVKSAYQHLKSLLQKKCNTRADLMEALDGLEKKPDSPGRKGILGEELGAAGVQHDAEILAAAKVLMEAVEKVRPDLGRISIHQEVKGGIGHAISGTGAATVIHRAK